MDNFVANLSVIIIGLIIGSFINVLSYRIPKNLSVIFSRSICPKCNSFIPLYRNIPIITYILQRGKCHHCNSSISIQYPFIELTTAIIFFLGLTLNNYSLSEYILFLWVASMLITIAIIDLKTLTIPLSLLLSVLLGQIVFLFLNISQYKIMFLGFMYGFGYLGLTFIVTSIIYKKQTLGYGDLLLISLIGLWLGPINILICIFLSSITGLIIWIIRYFKNIENNKLPMGTYLSISAIILKILNLDFMAYMNSL